MKISFVGISHLSLCYSAAALAKGFEVTLLDSYEIVSNYNKNNLNINEPKLKFFQKKFHNKFRITNNFETLNNTSIIFIAVDIITTNRNNVIYDRLNKLIRKTRKFVKKIKPLVIMSQVEVGFTRKIAWPNKYKYHYVETLVFGNAINRAINPERIIIGKYKNTNLNKNLNYFLKTFKCEILQFTFEESEFTKAMINIYLASQITTTNFLNSIITNFEYVSWSNIRKAISLDKRIGKYAYLYPGLGISGGNIERDIQSLRNLQKNNNQDFVFLQKIQNYSKFHKEWVIKNIPKKTKNIGILGLTYKENTLSQKNSPQKLLLNWLKKNKIKYLIHDFKFNELVTEKNIIKDLNIVLENSDTIVIFHKILQYKNIVLSKNIKYILDPFSVLNINKINSKVKIIKI